MQSFLLIVHLTKYLDRMEMLIFEDWLRAVFLFSVINSKSRYDGSVLTAH